MSGNVGGIATEWFDHTEPQSPDLIMQYALIKPTIGGSPHLPYAVHAWVYGANEVELTQMREQISKVHWNEKDR